MAMFTTMHSAKPCVNVKIEKETIHSGHFMVSHFEAEEQDDEDDLSVPVPESTDIVETKHSPIVQKVLPNNTKKRNQEIQLIHPQQLCIDHSLSKLFQCMSLAYRQKLTSPKWNRFRGIRLRWKDKIRLNNVIWRCWHMQFIKRENTLICQFASPLDVDTHNKPEAVVLEGKYWKRKLAAVTAEYKKWRMFYRNLISGHSKDTNDMLTDIDLLTWDSHSSDNMHMLVDEDYMEFMSDTLFSTITNQPFAFPDSREIAKAGLADFIQPSLGPLQPNLDDFYMDTFDAFPEGKLTTVPEQPEYYPELDIMGNNTNVRCNNLSIQSSNVLPQAQAIKNESADTHLYNSNSMMISQEQLEQLQYNSNSRPPPPYQSTNPRKLDKQKTAQLPVYSKGYQNYSAIGTGEYGGNESIPILNYKIAGTDPNATTSTQGYKFTAPMPPNLKFPSPIITNSNNFKLPVRQMSAPMLLSRSTESTSSEVPSKPVRPRGRPRSRSNTREPIKKPPLLSANSDPSLLTPSNSLLLTQLLTSNSDSNSIFTSSPRKSVTNIRPKEEIKSIPIINQPTTTLIITSPVLNNQQPSTNISEPLMLNTSSNSSLELNSQTLHSPTSSQSSIGSPNGEGHRDHRRAGHIHAEQKRRYNIKNGFDMMHSLIPHLNQNPNAKLSKAAMLQKGAEYIRQLRAERSQLKDEMDGLKQQIESLNTSISNCQSLLPATGAPVSRRQDNKMQEMFEQYVRRRTLDDWKFWIFSLLFRPLLLSFNNFVGTSSMDDLYSTTLVWIEQHCTLVDLRPVVLNSLRYLCTKTDILAEPEKLPNEARQAVMTSPTTQNQSPTN